MKSHLSLLLAINTHPIKECVVFGKPSRGAVFKAKYT
jgi:uncharacterized protein (UPF0218 family)